MKSYKNTYEIVLCLADNKLREEEDLRNYEIHFKAGQEIFNESSKLAKNPKTMEIMQLGEREIKLILTSEEVLTTPAISLQGFSRYLANNPETEHLVKNKALFRSESTEVKLEEKMMSDAELLKELVDLVLSGRKEQKQVLEEIKDVLLSSKK